MEPALIAIVTVESCGPSAMASSTPVTVTVWGVSQSAGVNTIDVGDTVASPVSEAEAETTTLAVGSVSNTTLNVAVDAAPKGVSVTVIDVPDSVNPTVSSSTVVAVTAWAAMAS